MDSYLPCGYIPRIADSRRTQPGDYCCGLGVCIHCLLLCIVVLMYPPDRPHAQIRRHVRQPAMPLHSVSFAEPKVDKNKPLTPSPDEEETTKQVTKVT